MACEACEPSAQHRSNLALRKVLRVGIGTAPPNGEWHRGIDYILSIEEPTHRFYGDAQVLCICEPELHVTPLGAGLMLVSGGRSELLAWAATAKLGASGYLVVCVDGSGEGEPEIQDALDVVFGALKARGQDPDTVLCFDATDRLVRWEVTTRLFDDRPHVDVVFELL